METQCECEFAKDVHPTGPMRNRLTPMHRWCNIKIIADGAPLSYLCKVPSSSERKMCMHQRSGEGKMWMLDGSVYDGQWKDDLMDGNGRHALADGAVYDGAFVNGQRHGHGTLT